jgi:methyltransferase (TIGR00027 family)
MLTVSDTAYAIATIRAEEAELPESQRLLVDPYAHIFAAAGAHASEGTARFLALPFFREGIRLRARHIDDVVREAIARGTRQLVLMGAGFDARALRLPEVAQHGVQTFELDFPALLDAKRSLLAGADVALPSSVHYLAVDFTTSFEAQLLEALLASGFDRARPAIFVWEGVTAYIGHPAIDRCLQLMASIGAAGSQVVFDFSEYLFDTEPARERARRAGFPHFEEIGFDVLWRRHFPGEPFPSAEMIKIGIAST